MFVSEVRKAPERPSLIQFALHCVRSRNIKLFTLVESDPVSVLAPKIFLETGDLVSGDYAWPWRLVWRLAFFFKDLVSGDCGAKTLETCFGD